MSIDNWVAKNCSALQPVLDTAEAGIKNGLVNETWQCPNCKVKVAARRRKLISGYGMQLIDAKKCKQIPPLDEKLP